MFKKSPKQGRAKKSGLYSKLRSLINARVLLTFGLVSLVMSALLGAMFIGAIPDREGNERQARAALAETVAATLMVDLADGRIAKAQAILEFVLSRNDSLVSLAIRNEQGEVISAAGPHLEQWQARADGKSTDTHILVPLAGNGGKWGQTELHFKPIAQNKIWLWQADERLQLLLIVGLCCSFSFFIYLGRMLKQLDPSRAVPDRVKSALDTLSEGLLLLDQNGQIVLANQAFGRLVGRTQEQLLGTDADTLAWHGFEPNQAPWHQALASGKTQLNIAIGLTDCAGKQRSFLANCAPVKGDKNAVGGVLLSLADVTELQEKEIQLIESKAQADSANRAKSDFLANMSHEIRTPMNAVLGFTDLLRRGVYKDPSQAQHYLNTVHSSGKHLLGLINDILDLSKVEAGKLEVEKLSTPIHDIIAETIEVLQVRATEKGIKLSYQLDGPIPESINTDAGRIRQIMTNLTGNAIKFTEKGEVKVVHRWIAKNNRMEIDVIDSGIGIPADKVEGIFQPFTQAETSTTRRFGGTGLGLSISQKFVQALGGDIIVTSQFGKGSCFKVVLDAVQASDALLHKLPARQTQQSIGSGQAAIRFARTPILVVDDSLENRELLKAVLIPAGLEVDEAENGAIAVAMASQKQYAVILMDMQMPVMDGFTATRTLRQSGHKEAIIAFTAHALKGFEQEITQAGCSGYLTKPIDIDQVMALLAKYIKVEGVQRRREQEFPTQATSNSPLLSPRASMPDLTTESAPLVSRLASNINLRNVINIFVERMPKQLAAMQTAQQNSNWEELANLAHWLKGSAGSVGYDGYTEPSKFLEEAAKEGNAADVDKYMKQVIALTQRLQPISGFVASPVTA
jgi:PAS domain S-box-containing protein